jgi:hypothetical protein
MADEFLRRAKDFVFGSDKEDSEYSDRQVHPASEDPYGDPADEQQYENLRPASEDPYGDPADEDHR